VNKSHSPEASVSLTPKRIDVRNYDNEIRIVIIGPAASEEKRRTIEIHRSIQDEVKATNAL
jgi:hypothetical protein